MDISSISQYYNLEPIRVRPNQLLLDPSNPRIVLDVDTERSFTPSQLATPDVQEYILSVINKQSYHIAELIKGIRTSGFIDKGDDMIVKRIPKTDKYLVIEGNRRTTAIKHLLNDESDLKPVVRQTLTELHVKEFVYRPNPDFTENAVIDILLGTIHITGRLPWGALERAYYVYNSYLRELEKYTLDSGFAYNVSCAREIATFFNLTARGVRKEIIIYRVYEQLKEQGYDVFPRHFSLIEMAISDRTLSDEYFELTPDAFHLSSAGLARFNKLCIRDEKPINNPKDFRIFAKVFKEGTEYEVALIESNEQPISSVLDRLNARLEQREFLNQLEKIKTQLGNLLPAGFCGTKAEIRMIEDITELVAGKLGHLVERAAKRS